MPENRLPRKSLQYQPQGKRDLGRPYRRSYSCRTEIDYPKLRMEEEEEEEENLININETWPWFLLANIIFRFDLSRF